MSAGPGRPDLPSLEQSRALAGWLAGPRSRALRRAGIGLRRRVLEVGSGHGVVTEELRRRCAGTVTCLDRDACVLGGAVVHGVPRAAADCLRLPFRAASFDLVFFQNVLLWVAALQSGIAEAARVLEPGGILVAIEPDYGGMMEHPDLGLRKLWLSGLSAAGADPLVGRKLPAACEAAGLRAWVELAHIPRAAEPEAVGLLDDLPLTGAQRERAHAIEDRIVRRGGEWDVFAHVPYFLVVARRGGS